MKYFITLVAFILLIRCSNNNSEVNESLVTQKKICRDTITNDNYSNRYCEVFYSSGELKERFFTKNDSILQGSYMIYYKNGNIMDSLYYAGGGVFGIRKMFFADGSKKSAIEYVFLGEDSYRNCYVEYDSINGDIISDKSFYYSFVLNNVSDGDSVDVEFNFNLPYYQDTAYLEIGNYDEFFRELNEYDKITVPIVNNKASFTIKKNKERPFIRGVIYNFNLNNQSEIRNFYFFEKY